MNRLRVGLSGAGPTGSLILERMRLHTHCEAIAVHDEDPLAARRLALAAGVDAAPESFEALLGTGIDFVVLAGPPAQRLPQVTAAAEQGVHCLVVSPLALDLATARQLAATAEGAGIRLGVAVPGQGDPVLDQLRRMIHADCFGGIVGVQAIWGEDDLLRTGTPAIAGSPFATMLVHHVHLVAWLVGRRYHRVAALTTRGFSPHTEEGGAAVVTMHGNVQVSFVASHLTRARALAIHGTDGGIRLAGDRTWISAHRPFAGAAFDYVSPRLELVLDHDRRAATDARVVADAELVGRFARWIEDCDDFPCPIEQALEDLHCVDAMVRAAALGTTVTI